MISLQDNAWIDEAVEKIVKKMDLVSERSRNKIPYTAQNGVHDDRSREDQTFSADDGLNWWCNGFWAGMLWQMYHAAGNEKYAEIARISEEKLDRCFSDYYGRLHVPAECSGGLPSDREPGFEETGAARCQSSGRPVQSGGEIYPRLE